MKRLAIVILCLLCVGAKRELPDKVLKIIEKECRLYPSEHIEPFIIRAIIEQESENKRTAFNKNRVNSCYGYMQVSDVFVDYYNYLLTLTHEDPPVVKYEDLYDPYTNIHLGVYCYAICLKYSDYDVPNALFFYNNGWYATNTNYVYAIKVLKRYEMLINSSKK